MNHNGLTAHIDDVKPFDVRLRSTLLVSHLPIYWAALPEFVNPTSSRVSSAHTRSPEPRKFATQ